MLELEIQAAYDACDEIGLKVGIKRNKPKRFGSYKKVANKMGYIGRTQLQDETETIIKRRYPDPRGIYVGFKKR